MLILVRSLAHKDKLLIRFNENIAKHREKGLGDERGENLYSKQSYYTVMVEQHVLAKDKDEADKLFLEGGGIDHSKITTDITETKDGVETTVVDANYTDSGKTTYLGKVAYDEDDEYAEEDGNVVIDTYADENSLTEKEESDVDVAIQLQAEEQRGK